MMAKLMKTLELHYPMIQFLIIIFDLYCFDFQQWICSSGSAGEHSVLFGNAARLNVQFDMLELNTRVFLVVITGCPELSV